MRDWKAELRPRLASLHLSPAREASILDELSQHLEDRREALMADGADDETATALTLAELERADLLAPRLGALAQARWQPPPAPGVPNQRALAGAWQDLRYAARTLRRDPLFTGIAVLTLTCGIGLNTAMFGFMNALLFRPLPFAEPAQLVRLFRTTAERQAGGFSAAEYLALRRAEDGFGRFAAFRPSTRALADAARSSEWLDVSAELFDVLGVQPVMGRAFRAEDEVPGNHRVVLISTALWQDQFGGAADVVGRSLRATDGRVRDRRRAPAGRHRPPAVRPRRDLQPAEPRRRGARRSHDAHDRRPRTTRPRGDGGAGRRVPDRAGRAGGRRRAGGERPDRVAERARSRIR